VQGNHENKLLRVLRGRKVTVRRGLALSLSQLSRETADFRAEVEQFLDGLAPHYVFDGGNLVTAHAGLAERFHGRDSAQVTTRCLYGEPTGGYGAPGRSAQPPWVDGYRGRAAVVYGHESVRTPQWVNNTICLDTGCGFDGPLTALRYPERELVAVPSLVSVPAGAPVHDRRTAPRAATAHRHSDPSGIGRTVGTGTFAERNIIVRSRCFLIQSPTDSSSSVIMSCLTACMRLKGGVGVERVPSRPVRHGRRCVRHPWLGSRVEVVR
jgi:hypothetical protein